MWWHDAMYAFTDLIMHFKITDLLDIFIIAYMYYKLYGLIKETRAEQLLKGIVIILVALELSDIFDLYAVHFIIENTVTVGLTALIVVFQPELRSVLEHIGRTKIIKGNGNPVGDTLNMIDEVISASMSLSRQKIGALIVFERETGLNEIISTGTMLNADVTRQLLINIFIPNTPLHDGASIIRKNRIIASACFLPLSENKNISKELGTRHRAAIGITERSDAISLVVSEETGAISIAVNGKIYRDLSKERLERMLVEFLVKKNEKLFKKGDGENKDAKNN